jgi:hypothetical protein
MDTAVAVADVRFPPDCVAKLGFFFASGNCSVSFDHPIVSAAV